MVFVKEDSVRNYGLQKELIFLFFPVAFMMILLVRWYLENPKWTVTQSCKSSQKPLVVSGIFSGRSKNPLVVSGFFSGKPLNH